MGLSTASERHPHVMVMAPALTKVSQSHKNFNLPPHIPNTQVTVPITARDDCSIYRSFNGNCNGKPVEFKTKENLNFALVSELLNDNKPLLDLGEDSTDLKYHSFIMNGSSPHMGDHTDDKMGLQKAGLEVSTLFKEKSVNNDIDQLFNNLPMGNDIGQNMDELIQVIKSIENANDKLTCTGNDLGPESDTIFQLSGTDLTSNLSSFEKEFLNDVDVMNITMEEQFIDGTKEIHSKEVIKELETKMFQFRRRIDFMLRRLRKTQAKHMARHISEEVAGIFEHVHRTLRRTKDPFISGNSLERLKPISRSSAKNLIRKLELSTIMQANASGRRQSAQYFGAGSVETSSIRSALLGATTIPKWTPEYKSDLERVVGSLRAETRLLQEEIDSDATLSSSGAESCDEMETYNNPHQQYLSIEKRALWKYSKARASIASRWTWIQAQIPDLEYRIHKYNDIYNQMRSEKGDVQLAGESPPPSQPTSPSAVNGYRGQLPGASPLSLKHLDSEINSTVSQAEGFCSRTRPLINFRKRKLLQTWGIHAISKKAARSSTIRCGCVPPTLQCALCTGRTDPTRPRELPEHLSKSERVSLLDPSFHPVFSLNEDISTTTHLEAIMRTSEWQLKSTRPSIKNVKFISKNERINKNGLGMEHQPKKQYTDHRKKYSRLLKSTTISALTAKLKDKFRGRKPALHSLARLRRKQHAEKLALAQLPSSAVESSNEDIDPCGLSNSSTKTESRSSSPLLPMQSISGYKRNNRISSYDIDNIVIPYSVAAATRVERLQYKEILTPKWRIVEPDFTFKYPAKNNGLVRDAEHPDSDNEDILEETLNVRHDKCQQDERKKFLRYLKFPYGYGRTRSHKRTDSRAESSGANSPDPMSPQPSDAIENLGFPIASPPATPLSVITEEHLPSISIMRRRTMIQSLRGKDKEIIKEEVRSTTPEAVEVMPYERRTFPLCDDTFDKILKLTPEDNQFQTNICSQDCISPINNFIEDMPHSHDSESTESALGDEDPNDPEWLDMER